MASALKLAKLTKQDDIEAYLTVFERTMCAYKVERSRWSYMLALQLTGRAQKVFAVMETEQSGNYDALKNAILTRYDINEEAYHHPFNGRSRRREKKLTVSWPHE